MEFLYGREFHSKRHKHRSWQIAVGKFLCETFQISSVIDFGCAIGSFLEGFQQAGADVQGYEYGFEFSREFTPEVILPFIQYGDVTKPIQAPVSDCAFSIEVAEHIPKVTSDQFVQNLCDASNHLIIVSIAPPGQGGVGHINCQPREFWLNKFSERGFFFDVAKTDIALHGLNQITGCKKWVKSNLMVLSNEAVH